MRCPRCEKTFPAGVRFCPEDGDLLQPESAGADPLVGSVVDERYRIDGRLGAGGMGVIYRAHQLTVSRDVAIKVLSADAAGRPDVARRFRVEARTISSLRHPNTVKLIDFGALPDKRLYLVLELLHGEPLDQVLARGPLSPARTLTVLRQVLDALAEAHDAGVVHRDLKPANLFVERIGRQEVVKVLDFGIARMLEGTPHTATGSLLGTPSYMSPEQAQGKAVGPRSDLYSLGVVAYHCLTGRQPFTGSTPYSVLMKHVQEPPPPLELSLCVPPEVETLLFRMLAKSPDDRPPSAEAAAEEVRRAERALPGRFSETLDQVGPAPVAPSGAAEPPSGGDTNDATLTAAGSSPPVTPRTPSAAPHAPAPGTPGRGRVVLWAGAVALVAALVGWALLRPAEEASGPVAAKTVTAPSGAAGLAPAARPPALDAAAPDAAAPALDVGVDATPPEPDAARAVDAARPAPRQRSPKRRRAAPRAPVPAIASIDLSLSPRRAAYRVGEVATARASARTADGAAVPATIRWKVTPPEVALVDDGRLRCLAPGKARLEACAGRVCATTRLLVVAGLGVP